MNANLELKWANLTRTIGPSFSILKRSRLSFFIKDQERTDLLIITNLLNKSTLVLIILVPNLHSHNSVLLINNFFNRRHSFIDIL